MENNYSRRNFIKKAGMAGAAVATVRESFSRPAKKEKIQTKNTATSQKPNILYIHSHDTGRYIQPYGYDVPTPNIQKLANEGILFRQCYTTHPTCSPSRGSLLTGMHPHSNGLIGLAHRGFSLNDYNKHIIHTLHDHGYTSALAGIQHIVDHHGKEPHKKIGYKEWVAGTWDFNEMNKIVDWIEDAPEKPFFLSVGFGETHRKFHPKNWRDNKGHVMPAEPLPDTPETRDDWVKYKETARILDEKMGMVFDALERTGLAENTLVICTTDHGIAFPRMKCNLYDGGTGIMLIMRGPGGFTGGKTADALVSNIDIFPTICELLDIDKPAWLQGTSMMPLVKGEQEEINENIYTEVNYHASYQPMRSVRTKRYKYIKHYDDRNKPVLPNCDDGPSKQLWLKSGWQDETVPSEELYDIIFDPNEQNNLVGSKEKQDILKDMRDRLQKQMENTSDPLLQGFIPAPKTAKLNDPDDIHPSKDYVTPKYMVK